VPDKSVKFTVNGHHTYSFTVSAQVVPIEVEFSKSFLDFRFSPDSTTPIIREFVYLQNKANARAEISWQIPNGPFSIPTRVNSIEPKQSVNVEVVYIPTTRPHEEANIILNIVGGPSRALKCVAQIGSPKCSLSKKSISFGLIPIGITNAHQLKLKNTSEDDAIFVISIPPDVPEIQILPINGRVSANDSHTLQINLNPISARVFDVSISISICGASPLTFNVTGQSELPRVQMVNSDFDFGRVFVGSSFSKPATISNIGDIPALLFLDLSTHPEFRIQFPSELSDDHPSARKSSISLVSDPLFITKLEAVGTYLGNDHSGTKDATPAPGGGLIYKFQVLAHVTVAFNLVFQPTVAAEHSFELPLAMTNVGNSASYGLQPFVTAEAILAPVTISKLALDFGIVPIFNPSNPNNHPILRLVTLTNESNQSIPWHFDLSNPLMQNPAVFSIKPESGILEGDATVQIQVFFTSQAQTPYHAYLPLYVSLDGIENQVSSIRLTAVGTSLVFRPSVSELCFPIVPIGSKLQYELQILNIGHVQASLRVEMGVDEAVFPLKVTFPDGNQLNPCSPSLPLLLTFLPSKSISGSTVVALLDDAGHAATFSVTCTADNCCYTLYPYLANPIQLKEKIS
jgi:hypothetical protein